MYHFEINKRFLFQKKNQIHSNVSNMFGNWTIGVPKEFKQLVYVSTAAFC